MTRFSIYLILPLSLFLLITDDSFAQTKAIMEKEVISIPGAPTAPACECPPKEKKNPENWDLGVSLGFNLSQGNADTRLMSAGVNARKEKDKNIYKLVFSAAEGEQNGEVSQRFARGDASYDRLLTDRAYTGVGGTFLTDDIADVDYRLILNSSLGYFLAKSDDLTFSVETGPAYVFEKQGGTDDNYFAVRFGNDFTWKFSESGSIFQRSALLVNTERADDYLIIAKAGIEAALNSMLSLVFAVEDRFDNSPAAGAKKNDVLITSSLKLSF